MQSTVKAEANAEGTAPPEQVTKAERKKLNVVLWVIQGLLALLYLFAGATKFILPMDQMLKRMPIALSATFVRFIGVAELAGALGLILPGLLKTRPGLTPLAAAGLFIIMTGATVITAMGGQATQAATPLLAGLLVGFVAFGRWRLVPLKGKKS